MPPLAVARLDSRAPGFDDDLDARTRRRAATAADVEARVREIIAQVRARGDAALLEYAARYDKLEVQDAAALRLAAPRVRAAAARVPADLARAAWNTPHNAFAATPSASSLSPGLTRTTTACNRGRW